MNDKTQDSLVKVAKIGLGVYVFLSLIPVFAVVGIIAFYGYFVSKMIGLH
jgi:hypothetical protein